MLHRLASYRHPMRGPMRQTACFVRVLVTPLEGMASKITKSPHLRHQRIHLNCLAVHVFRCPSIIAHAWSVSAGWDVLSLFSLRSVPEDRRFCRYRSLWILFVWVVQLGGEAESLTGKGNWGHHYHMSYRHVCKWINIGYLPLEPVAGGVAAEYLHIINGSRSGCVTSGTGEPVASLSITN